jgi:hypothetical protein
MRHWERGCGRVDGRVGVGGEEFARLRGWRRKTPALRVK